MVGSRSTAGLARLLELAPVVAIKEGSEGSRVLWRQAGGTAEGIGRLDVATTAITASDTTGAGDAYAAGFLLTLLRAGRPALAPWSAALLRRAALAGHRSAVDLLRRPRPELPG
jgi:sugar/nucleoside kinase (ribokinase family)